MGEIVRVLKWRLDLDSAGMAEGVDKAATSAERLAKAATEVGEKGTAGLKKVSVAAEETGTAFEGLGYEAQQVEMYVSRLEKGSGSPLVLKRNAEQAEAAFNVLAQAAQKAGVTISESFSDRVIAAIGKGTTQAAAMNAELEKMGGQTPTKLDKVITALEKTEKSSAAAGASLKEAALRSTEMSSGMGLIASVGGPAGMALSSVASQGSKLGNEMVVLAGKMALVTAAAKLAWDAGRKLDEGLKQAGVDLSDGPIDAGLKQLEERLKRTSEAARETTPSMTGLLTGTAALDNGLASLPKRLKDAALDLVLLRDSTEAAGKSSKGLTADIALDDERLTAHTKALQGQIVARRVLQNELAKTAGALKEALPGWVDATTQQQKLSDEIAAVALKFKAITSANGDWRKEVQANQEPLAAFVKKLEEKKVALDSLPAPLQEAIKYLKELEAAAKGVGEAVSGIDALKTAIESIGKGDTAKSLDDVVTALQKIRAEGGNVGEAVAKNEPGFQKLRDAAEKNYESLQKFRTEIMDQIPAYQATALASAGMTEEVEKQIAAFERYEAARRKANEADIEASIQMAKFRNEATQTAYAIDSIGDAWFKATGQAAGFTVEVRHATKAVQETTPEFDALVESLAVTSDEWERMTPYVGALIAQLEAGKIGPEEFGKAIDNLRVAFMQIQGVSGQMFGDIESLFNKLRHQVNEFVARGKGAKK